MTDLLDTLKTLAVSSSVLGESPALTAEQLRAAIREIEDGRALLRRAESIINDLLPFLHNFPEHLCRPTS